VNCGSGDLDLLLTYFQAQRNYLIKELITWKDYEIQIAAYNNMGIGVFSEGVKIKTKEGGM
jgi:protein sidekick